MSRRTQVIIIWFIIISALCGFECFSRLERVHIAEEDLVKIYKKVVQLSGTSYIAVDDKGDIHHVSYLPYRDTVIIEYAEVTDGMIDWEAFNEDKEKKVKKRKKNVN